MAEKKETAKTNTVEHEPVDALAFANRKLAVLNAKNTRASKLAAKRVAMHLMEVTK